MSFLWEAEFSVLLSLYITLLACATFVPRKESSLCVYMGISPASTSMVHPAAC